MESLAQLACAPCDVTDACHLEWSTVLTLLASLGLSDRLFREHLHLTAFDVCFSDLISMTCVVA